MRRSKFKSVAPYFQARVQQPNALSWILSRIPMLGLAMTEQVLLGQIVSMSFANLSTSACYDQLRAACQPNQSFLGERLDRSRQTINRHIQKLAASGCIQKLRRGRRKTNMYFLGGKIKALITDFIKYIQGKPVNSLLYFIKSDVKKTGQPVLIVKEEPKEKDDSIRTGYCQFVDNLKTLVKPI